MSTEIEMRIGELSIIIKGRQFPSSEDFWDGNWLDVAVTFRSDRSSVCASGSILHLSEIDQFLVELEALYQSLKGVATLNCIEPNLRVVITAKSGGRMLLEVSITPDHLTENHQFVREIDQSYLLALIGECRKTLAHYPIKNAVKT